MAAFHFPAAAFIVRAGAGVGVSAGVAAGAEADAQVVAFFLVVVLQITEAECAGVEVQVAAVGAVVFDVGNKGAVHLRMVTHLDVHRLSADHAGLFRYPRAAAVGFAVADTGTTAHPGTHSNTAAGIPALAVYAASVLQGFRVQVVAYIHVQVLRLQVGSTDRGVIPADHGQGVPGGDGPVAVVDVSAGQVVFPGADIGGKADAVAAEVNPRPGAHVFFIQLRGGVALPGLDRCVVVAVAVDVAVRGSVAAGDAQVVGGVDVDIAFRRKAAAGGGNGDLLQVGFGFAETGGQAGVALRGLQGDADLLRVVHRINSLRVLRVVDADIFAVDADVPPGSHIGGVDVGGITRVHNHIATGTQVAAARTGLLGLLFIAGGGLAQKRAAAGGDIVHRIHCTHDFAGVADGVVALADVADRVDRLADIMVGGYCQAITGETALRLTAELLFTCVNRGIIDRCQVQVATGVYIAAAHQQIITRIHRHIVTGIQDTAGHGVLIDLLAVAAGFIAGEDADAVVVAIHR